MSASDATALRERLVGGECSVRDVALDALARIERHDPLLHCFLDAGGERALARADELDAALAAGAKPGPLFGLPVALKANLCLAGRETHCGSRALEGYVAPYTATAVQRLLDAGAVPLGVTNMDEFGMGSSGENSAFGPTRNPWDPTRTAGGSSCGSAAAVAAELVPLALGSDTGGSVRQPAALSGVAGFKPSYGRVSRYGLVAFGSSLDQVGPLARSVRDLQRVFGVLAGADERDPTSRGAAPTEAAHSGVRALEGLRLGVPEEYFGDGLSEQVQSTVLAAIDALVARGARRVPLSLPHTRHAIATYYVVACAEASSNLARYDGVRYGVRAPGDGTLQGMIAASRAAGFGPEVKRRILLGTHVLSSGYHEAWYGRALRVRARIAADFARAFEQVDVVLGPTSPTTAFPLGERTADPVSMYLADALTTPASLAGLPAVSVPCGLVPEGDTRLPVGLQIIGPRLADELVLGVARAFEQITDHHAARPPARSEAPTVRGAIGARGAEA